MVPLALLLLFLLNAPSVFPYNYLVLSPGFGHSHSTFMGKIADTLKDAGHDVTILTLVMSSKMRNVSYTKSVTDVVYIETSEEIEEAIKSMETGDFSRFWVEDGGILDTIPTYKSFMKIFEKVFTNVRANTHILDNLRKTHKKFDALVFEGFIFIGRIVQEYLEIPTFVPVTSVTHDNIIAEMFGEPVNPSYLSGYFSNFGNVMTFEERVKNTISYFLGKHILQWPKWKTLQDPNKLLDLTSAYPTAPFIFTNSNPYIDFPRPLLSKTVQIGGITVDVDALRSHKVDEKWEEIMNRRPHNILVSFGSMFHSVYMPDSYKSNFVSVMKSLPNVTFIWKYESEDVEFAQGAENIVFSKWVPQTALLADHRLSAFLTHGGLGSVNELSYLGTPAILCPLFADQLRNAKMLARHNGSIEISKFDLPNYSALRGAFQRILFDESYARNARNLARRLEKQPIKPKELLVRHMEFAAEFGEHSGLDCPNRHMSFISYFLLDVIALFATVVAVIIGTVYLVIRRIVKLVRKQKVD